MVKLTINGVSYAVEDAEVAAQIGGLLVKYCTIIGNVYAYGLLPNYESYVDYTTKAPQFSVESLRALYSTEEEAKEVVTKLKAAKEEAEAASTEPAVEADMSEIDF